MKIFAVLLAGLLAAQEPIPLSHNPADFTTWGTPVQGVSAGVHATPLPSADAWFQGFRFQVMIKNDTDQPFFVFTSGGHHGAVRLKVIDATGHAHALREGGEYPGHQPAILIQPHHAFFDVVFVRQDEALATGGHPVVALVDVYDKPAATDPAVHVATIETAPFPLVAGGPVEATLPDDPMLAQWQKKEAELLQRLQESSTENRSSNADILADFYIEYLVDLEKARALVPQMTDPIDHFDIRVMLIEHDASLPETDKVAKLKALLPDCPSQRRQLLEKRIAEHEYTAHLPH